jgi:zeaxanthin glucosyltransferase
VSTTRRITGHLHPMTALGRKMQARGHEVIFFGLPDAARIVHSAGLDFVPFGEAEYPSGQRLQCPHIWQRSRERMSSATPPRRWIAADQDNAGATSGKIARRNVEALVLDPIHFFAELVPIKMGIPYAHIWNPLHIDSSGAPPPCFFGWDYEDTPVARARNMEAAKNMNSVFQPIQQVARSWAENHGLQIDWDTPNATISKLAVITQTPKEFDFPDVPQPRHFTMLVPFMTIMGEREWPFRGKGLPGNR